MLCIWYKIFFLRFAYKSRADFRKGWGYIYVYRFDTDVVSFVSNR